MNQAVCLEHLQGTGCTLELVDYYADDRIVLVMEYPNMSYTLQDCLKSFGRQLPSRMTWKQVIAAIANSLMMCQDNDVFYRGLDPRNVVFCASGDKLKLLLLQSEWCDLENKIDCVYREGYRSPEQDLCDDFNRESAEVYALGCVLADMVKAKLAENSSGSRTLIAEMKAKESDNRPSLERIAHHRFLNGDF
jgi:hypothetical protein